MIESLRCVLCNIKINEEPLRLTHSGKRDIFTVGPGIPVMRMHDSFIALCLIISGDFRLPLCTPTPPQLPHVPSNELWSVISHYSGPDYPAGILRTLADNFLKVTFIASP